MACEIVGKQRAWSGDRDSEGYRTYKIKWLIRCDPEDGPANVMRTPGLPIPGLAWIFDNDVDLWVWCRPNAVVQPHQEREGDPHCYWTVEQTFSNKPPGRDGSGDGGGAESAQCSGREIEDPLLEPQKVSGTFVKFTEEATRDRFGNFIQNSAHEIIRGPLVEFDANRPQIRIEQNVAVLGLDVFAPMIDTVNDAPLWGVPARCVKLSNVSWERRFHGTCYVYYTRTLEFDIHAKVDPDTGAVTSGFDRTVPDEGTKVLWGEYDRTTGEWQVIPVAYDDLGNPVYPSEDNPLDFQRFKDRAGENARVILNGHGMPINNENAGTSDDEPGEISIQKYDESNFLTLSIPLTF